MNTPEPSTSGGRAIMRTPMSPTSQFLSMVEDNDLSATPQQPIFDSTTSRRVENDQSPGTPGVGGRGATAEAPATDPFLSNFSMVASLSNPAYSAFTARIHRALGLTGAEPLLEDFRRSECSIERQYIILCSLLKMQQMVESGPTRGPSHWTMTNTLQKALRIAQAADLPNDTGTDDPILASFLRARLTTYRAQIKSKVTNSLTTKIPIADLTASIIHSVSAARPTAQLCCRIAFLRWHAMTFLKPAPKQASEVAANEVSTEDTIDKEHEDEADQVPAKSDTSNSDDWWNDVDKTLARYKKMSQVKLHNAMTKHYNEDKALFPGTPKTRVAEPETVAKWILQVDELAKDAVAEEVVERSAKRRKFGV